MVERCVIYFGLQYDTKYYTGLTDFVSQIFEVKGSL